MSLALHTGPARRLSPHRPPQAEPAGVVSSAQPRVLRRARPLLGTLVEVGMVLNDHPHAEVCALNAIAAAFDAVAQVQRLMSAHEPGSDLGRLNRATPGEWVEVHPWTAEVLQCARRWQLRTHGLFDVALGTGHWQWRSAKPSGQGRPAAHPHAFAHAEACNKAQALAQAPTPGARGARFQLRRLHAKCQLDLGGMAKGWAVDRALEAAREAAMEAAQEAGAAGVWVNAGGDLRCHGVSLPVALRDEAQGGVRPWLVLSDGALATSCFAPGARSALHGTLRAPHVSVAAPSCVLADVLTKVAAQCMAPAASSDAPSALATHRAGSSEWLHALAARHGARIWVHEGADTVPKP